jgi:hypothetical protein
MIGGAARAVIAKPDWSSARRRIAGSIGMVILLVPGT